MPIHLTAFGFTPTEERVYSALVDRGPTSAYALAKLLSVARANVYQALNGLRSKGAAVLTHERPQMFRPITPEALLALVTEREAAKLDLLEGEVRDLAPNGKAKTSEFSGERAFGELALRSGARAETASCLAPATMLISLVPLWRKRLADGSETKLWAIGEPTTVLPVQIVGVVDPTRIRDHFGAMVSLFVTPDVAVLGRLEEDWRGYWSSDSLLVCIAEAALDRLTAS